MVRDSDRTYASGGDGAVGRVDDDHDHRNDDDDNNMMMRMMMMKPAWLQGLMSETFFGGCGVHQHRRKNEKNIFCLLCCLSICPHCLPSHRSHPLLQVRRYVYHDVVRLGDLEKLIDCSYIQVQPYTINGAKVIFLKHRPQSRSCKGSSNVCVTCDRILQDPFHFCSLSCKVDHMVYQGEDLSSILYKINESDFAFSQFEGLRMDGLEVIDDEAHIMNNNNNNNNPNAIIDYQLDLNSVEQAQYKGRSSCSINEATSNSRLDQPGLVKKTSKKAGFQLPGIVLSLGNRRKGAPQRSPLS